MTRRGLLVSVLVASAWGVLVSPSVSEAHKSTGIAGPVGPSAAVVVPFLTSQSGTETLITVTNTGFVGIAIDVIVLEGASYNADPFSEEVPGSWAVVATGCKLTGFEVAAFTAVSSGGGAQIVSSGLLCETKAASTTEAGVIFFAVQDGAGDVLLADWAVVDLGTGFAFGANGIGFKAGKKVNKNRKYVFHKEYSDFPARLSTNFWFPDNGCELADPDCRAAALLLFTLDGSAGTPPSVQVNIDYYDQFEQAFDTDWPFECFSIVHFHDISLNLTGDFHPGSEAGHMVLKASNAVRTPFLGWIIQSDFTKGAGGFWARPLTSGDEPFVSTEKIVFDAR